MSVHIAIPEPTSSDTAYNQRCLPDYLAALHSVGAAVVVVPLHERPDRIAELLSGVQGVLLPGSGFDVDPQTYGAEPIPACGPPDPVRAAIDNLLLGDAFNLKKPVLTICYGTQSLNVWRNGSLVQDLPTEVGAQVNHAPGRTVMDAHAIKIAPESRLGQLLPNSGTVDALVNSSHHQAIRTAGDNLVVAARSSEDGVVEAVELDSKDHFVVGVQWHPERTFTHSSFSRAILSCFVQAASYWQPPRIERIKIAS